MCTCSLHDQIVNSYKHRKCLQLNVSAVVGLHAMTNHYNHLSFKTLI